MTARLSRRRRMTSAGATALALLLASTSAFAYQQAPILDSQVADGTLPPVDERLPTNPRVIEPIDEIGEYGGTWRRAFRGRSDDRGPQKLMEPRIVRFLQTDESGFGIEMGWASDVVSNENSTEFTSPEARSCPVSDNFTAWSRPRRLQPTW